MCFRIADVKTLLVAALICSLFPAAKAQSNGGGQRILFSAPDGQTSSNTPVPMAQAPEPRESPNLPDSEVAVHPFFVPPEPPVIFPEVSPVLQPNAARRRNDSLDPMDIRKQMGALTPQEIMNVPSPEAIFGLAEKRPEHQKKPGATGDTNSFASATTESIDEPKWARTWSGDNQENAGSSSSNTTQKATGFFGGLFDSAQNGNGFGNHEASDSDTLFGPSQPAAQPGSWDSTLSGDTTPSASASESGFHAFTLPVAASSSSSSSGFGSSSPFSTPHVSSMATLPQLPAVPSLPGQNSTFHQPAAVSSLAPQPPPWTTRQTPFGTPVQLNQIH